MIDPLSLGIGGVVLLAGFVTGRAGHRKPPTPGLPQPICVCGHCLGAHTDRSGCQAEVRRKHYDDLGSRNGWEWVPCPCLRYAGPEPLSDIWVPPAGAWEVTDGR